MRDAAQGIRLNWTGEMMPHAVLDLLRGCNAACEGCYNAGGNRRLKPLSQIREELQTLSTLRRLQAISLTGGEPLLHPDLDAIVSDIRALGLRSVLMTNGICLDALRARQLKAVGLDMVLLHIQSRQNRPDVPSDNEEALWRLRKEKTACARTAGIDVGFSALMYPDAGSRKEIRDLMSEVTASDDVHFLMICPKADFSVFSDLQGAVESGYHQGGHTGLGSSTEAAIAEEAEALYALLREAGYGLFAWLGSSADQNELRWSTWGAGVLKTAYTIQVCPVRPVWTDRLLMRLIRIVTGRNLLHVRPSAARFRFQLALSLLSREWRQTAIPLLSGSFRAGTCLQRKHVMVELPPVRKQDGTIVFCRECPDATLHNGRLVPPCLIDRVTDLAPPAQHLTVNAL